MYNFEDTVDDLLAELNQPGIESDVMLTRRLLKKVKVKHHKQNNVFFFFWCVVVFFRPKRSNKTHCFQ